MDRHGRPDLRKRSEQEVHYDTIFGQRMERGHYHKCEAPKGMMTEERYGLREGQVEMKMLRKFISRSNFICSSA